MKKIISAITRYFKGVKKEIVRIRWTSLQDLFKYTLSTVIIMVCFGVFFYGIDMLVSLLRSMM